MMSSVSAFSSCIVNWPRTVEPQRPWPVRADLSHPFCMLMYVAE